MHPITSDIQRLDRARTLRREADRQRAIRPGVHRPPERRRARRAAALRLRPAPRP